MGEAGITSTLTCLAMEKHVSAITQDQELPALVLLYEEVPGIELV